MKPENMPHLRHFTFLVDVDAETGLGVAGNESRLVAGILAWAAAPLVVAFFLILTVVITAVRALAYDATVIQLSLLPALALGHLAEEREAHDFFGLLRVGTLDLGRQPSFRMSGGKTNKGFEGTRGQWRSLEENKRVEGRKIKG